MRRLAAALAALLLGLPAAAPAETLALSLREAVKRALTDGTAARIAADEAERARWKAAQARASLWPQVSGSVSDANNTLNFETFGFTFPGQPPIIGPFNVFDAHVTAAMNVVEVAARKRVAAARAGARSVEEERRRTENDVASAVAALYVAVQRAQAQLDETQANVALFRRLSELAQHQLEAGVATRLDTTRAEVQLSRQQQSLLLAQSQVAYAQLALLRAIGADLGDSVTLTDHLFESPRTPPPVAEAVAQALRDRPELLAGRERQRAADLSLGAVRAERLPVLGVQAQGGYSGNYANNLYWTRTVAAQISVPIFTGGSLDSRIAEARAARREMALEQRDLERQVEEEVRRALIAYDNATSRLSVARENERLAREELQFARDRFANGVSSDIEVDNAQTSLTAASDARVAALADQAQAWFDFLRATGRIRGLIEPAPAKPGAERSPR